MGLFYDCFNGNQTRIRSKIRKLNIKGKDGEGEREREFQNKSSRKALKKTGKKPNLMVENKEKEGKRKKERKLLRERNKRRRRGCFDFSETKFRN